MIPMAMMTTPRWTTMPPLARPTRPRHHPAWRVREARTESTRARAAVEAATAPRPNPIRGSTPRRPKATQTTMVSAPAQTGTARRCQSTVPLILRQLSTGATAIKKSRASPTGTATVLKYGRAHRHLLLGGGLVEQRVERCPAAPRRRSRRTRCC